MNLSIFTKTMENNDNYFHSQESVVRGDDDKEAGGYWADLGYKNLTG